MIVLLVFIGIALLFEAFFSGAETAFISVNFLKLMHLIEKKNKPAMMVHDILKKPDRLLTTTLIGTNISVVISSACATALFAQVWPAYSAFLATLVLTPVSFIFCQLLTKTVFRYRANQLVLFVAHPLRIAEKIFWPLVSFFTFFANSIASFVNPHGLRKNPFLTKDEIKSLIKDISREGILEAHEKEAIDKIFDMTLTKVMDIMVPLKNVLSFDVSESLEAIKEKCCKCRWTRFPVFEGKTLKGAVNIYDIFYSQETEWQKLIRPIFIAQHDESLDKVFSSMQPRKEMIAAVFKGEEMFGLLTMEDLMEEITSRLTAGKKG